MGTYILRRLLLMIPTLRGIMVVNILIVKFVLDGLVEQMIFQQEGHGKYSETARFPAA